MGQFNSKQYAFADIKVNIAGRTLVGFQGIKYTVKREKETIYGQGSKPLSIQSGNVSIEGELTILQSELESLVAAAKLAGTDVLDLVFDIPIVYGEGNKAVRDVVLGAEFMEFEKGMMQGDKYKPIALKFMALDVEYGK